MPNYVRRLEKSDLLTNSITESKLTEACQRESISSSGMMNWTTLAFLTQYITVCDDLELIKMQLRKWSENLAFELIPGSHASQTMCPFYLRHGGQVEPKKHYEISRWILMHGLLKYHHVKSSLFYGNMIDRIFWNDGSRIRNSSIIKCRIERALRALEEGYVRYKMLERETESGAIQSGEMKAVFQAFLVTMLSIVAGGLLRDSLCLVRRHPFLSEKRVSTLLSEVCRVVATTKGSMVRVRIAGEVVEHSFHRVRSRLEKVGPNVETGRTTDGWFERASFPDEESSAYETAEPVTHKTPSMSPDSENGNFGSVENLAIDGEAAATN